MTYFTGNQIDGHAVLQNIRRVSDYRIRELQDALSVYGSGTRQVLRGQSTDPYYVNDAREFVEFAQKLLQVAMGRERIFILTGLSNFPTMEGRVRGDIRGVQYAIYPEEPERGATAIQTAGWINGQPLTESDERTDIVVRELTGWSEGYVEITPAPELLERIPANARQYAFRTDVANSGTGARWVLNDNGTFTHEVVTSEASYPTGEEIIAAALDTYRTLLRERMQRPNDDAQREFEAKREEHRRQTVENFRKFAEREVDPVVHVPTLPFVPNGLASSRRWGIEVESGGARGVETPADWRAVSDGSLRSAYDGYVEVQDFEPYEEERTENRSWTDCENYERHQPRVEIYDADRREYIYVPRDDYIDPRECESCGPRTYMHRVEPQTIRHEARSGDCREFVSPILVSMHSRGLKQLTEALSRNPQNSSSGVHVHVEAGDLNDKQIQTLVFGYDVLEPLLESSYQRERRDFCRRRTPDAVLSHARDLRDGNQLNVDDRYLTLNLQALSRHGTIEFRAMGPVYNYDHLVRWAMLCRELVNVVAAGATMKDFSKVTSWSGLLNLLARFGKEYIRAAVYEMTGEVGEAAKLEKQGVPVTAEALAADLSAAWETLSAATRLSSDMLNNLADRLVGVGAASAEI